MRIYKLLFSFIILSIFTNCSKEEFQTSESTLKPWRFVVVGDTHVTTGSDTIQEMIPYFLKDSIDLIVVCGDIVEGGLKTTSSQMLSELQMWQAIFQPIYDKDIDVYSMRGNHENDVVNNTSAWNRIFAGSKAMPQNGPSAELNLTYSFEHKNAKFVVLDNYANIHRVNQEWLNQQLSSNTQPHIFAFGHEAAFKVFHSDCLDDYPTERNTFWKSLENAGVKTYFCGHDHFFDATSINNGDEDSYNDIYQILVGGGGGWLMSKYQYNGSNSPYTPTPMYHRKEHGYALVEVNGESLSDLEVTITWKERVETQGIVEYVFTSNVVTYTIQVKKK